MERIGLRQFVVYKLVVFGLAFVALCTVAHIVPQSPGHFVALMFQWDALHVLRVAGEGYLAKEPSIQIFPAFPMLIRAVQLVVRDWQWSAFLAAQGCSYLAFHYFYKLARTELNREQALIALALFAFFPTAYFLSVPYMEPAFCAASFAAVYYLRIESYGPAAVAAAVATLSRMNGLFLLPALVVHAFLNRDRLSRRQAAGLMATALAILAAFGVYLAMNWSLYGDPLYFLGLQGKAWGVHLSWPFKGALEAVLSWSARSPSDRMSIIVCELAFTFAALALLPLVWRRERAFDFTYTAVNLMTLVCLDFWLSRPRYVIILYPLFFAAAPWFERKLTRLGLYLLGSSALFGIYWALYLNAQWAF